jgi:hypothetical protein
MKFILIIFICISHFTLSAQKLTLEKIANQINKVDSLRFSKTSTQKKLKDMSACGGSVSSEFYNDTLIHIYAFRGVELYSSILRVYFKENAPVRIYYYEAFPEWDKFNDNPKNDTIEEMEDIINVMTYKETAVSYYFTEPIIMFQFEKGKEVPAPLNKELLKELLNCIETMKRELKD